MASQFKALSQRIAQTVNNRLGEPVTYQFWDGTTRPNTIVTIQKDNEVRNEYDQVVVFETVCSLLKSEIPNIPQDDETITTAEGDVYRISGLRSETISKWYVNLVVA